MSQILSLLFTIASVVVVVVEGKLSITTTEVLYLTITIRIL